MNYPILKILCGLLLFPILLFGQERETNFHHLTEAEGLSNNQVFYSIQDKQGFIWLATKSGLCRYDGYTFRNFTVEDNIARNDIRKVFLDSQNRLWILTRRQISLYKNGTFSSPGSSYKYIRDGRMLDVLEDSSQTIWFSSPRLISYIDSAGKHEQVRLPSKTLRARPRLLFVSPNNELYTLYDNTIYVIRDKEISHHIPLSYLNQNQAFTSTAIRLSNGKILYSSVQGLIQLNPKNAEEVVFCEFPEDFTAAGITQLFQDKDGDIWVSHLEKGILKIKHEAGKIYTESLLPGTGINHMMEDAEGDLWFSTQNKGVFLLSRNALQMRKTQTKLKHGLENIGFSMERSFKDLDSYGTGNLHLTEEKNIIEIGVQGTHFQLIRESEAPFSRNESIEDLIMISDNQALVRSSSRLFLYEAGTWQELFGISEPQVISRGPNNSLLITYDLDKTIRMELADLNMLLDSDGAYERVVRLQKERGLIPITEGIRITQEDSQGIIWGVWINGLYKIVNGEKISYPKDESIFNADIFDLKATNDSLIWIASNGSGLIAIKDEKLSVLDREKGMQGLVCNSLYPDPESGHIWVGTQTGLGRISDYNFARDTFTIKWFNEKDGLHSNVIKKVHKFGDHLWIAGEKGLSLIDDKKIQEESYAPPVYISKVEVDNTEQDLANEYKFAHDNNNVVIHFTGISYRNLGKLTFEYKLNDRDWTKVQSNPIRFESLHSGFYNFQVRAKSRGGMISDTPAAISFEILPAYYETWWFRFALVIGLGFLLMGLLRYFYSERQRIILEDTVDEKTYELNLKIEELHRSNQDLKQFAYVASHDLKTPLRTVIGHLQLLKIRMGGKLDKDGERAMNFAVDSSKSMYEMINHLLDYSRLGKESLEFEVFNLSDILAELEKSLHSAIKESNASIQYESFPDFIGVPTQWKILFQNLIENALKFNESDQPVVKISYRDSPDFWILSIRDNGIGIKEEYQPKIFDLFQRLHTHEYPGSGIGLAKCKRIVELHGGSIWIDSVEGEGTDFQFTIAKRIEK